MQSSLSQLLNREHDVILAAGKIIHDQRNGWLTHPADYERMVKLLLDFFTGYADAFHHQKEEEILFPAMRKKHEIIGGGIVQELMEHHREFRADLQQIREALAVKDYPATQGHLEDYLYTLKEHIAAENEELFPMAENIFSPDELDNLYYKCMDKDRELGITQKEKWEDLIKNQEHNEPVK